MKLLLRFYADLVALILSFSELKANDCRQSVNDLNYHGNISSTRHGLTCRQWRNTKYISEEQNFCRTPLSDKDNNWGPWCYTDAKLFYWDVCNVPICTAAVCPDLTVHNLVTLDRKTRYQYGESVFLACKSGYKLIGQTSLTCQQSGQWNDTIPRCEEVDECSSNPCLNGGMCTKRINGYICTCQDRYFGTNCHSEFGQALKIAPQILLVGRITVNEGSLVIRIPCFAEGLPRPYIKWESIDKISMASNAKQVVHYLIFENVTTADSGLYMCTAKNEMGTDIKVVNVIVTGKPSKLHTAPIIHALSSYQVDYYTDANLVCNVTGFPTPSVAWKYYNKLLQSTGQILVVQNVTNTTTGYYTCIASNDVGTHQVKILLKVTYDSPQIVTLPKTAVIMVGQSHNFTCLATGHPKPLIVWSFKSFAQDSKTMPSHQIHQEGHVLTLFALKTHESGTLTCTAVNEFGDEKASVSVIFRNPGTSGLG